jgi:hypothetical protein
LYLTVLNSFLFLCSCVARITHRDFQLDNMQNLGWERTSPTMTPSRPFVVIRRITQLEVNCSVHWPGQSSRTFGCLCFTWGIKRRMCMKCKKCDIGLSSGECFEDYQTGYRLWCVISGTETAEPGNTSSNS